MAALTPTNSPYRHIIGDLAVRFFNISGTNGDTLTVSGIADILDVVCTPTTAIAFGATWAQNVVTFITAGAFAGTVAVISRVG